MLLLSNRTRKISAITSAAWMFALTLMPTLEAIADDSTFTAGRSAGQAGVAQSTNSFSNPDTFKNLGVSGLGSTAAPSTLTSNYKGGGRNGLDSITTINQAGQQTLQTTRQQSCPPGDATCQAIKTGGDKYVNQLNGNDPRSKYKSTAQGMLSAYNQRDPLSVIGIGVPNANGGSVCIESEVDLPPRSEEVQCLKATMKTIHNLAKFPVTTNYAYTQPYCIDPEMTLSANQSLCSKTVYSCPVGSNLNGTQCVITTNATPGGYNCFPEGVVFTHKYADSPLRWELTNQSSGVVKAFGGQFSANNSARRLSATINIPDLSKVNKFDISPLGLGSYDDWLIVVINGVGVASSVGSGYTHFSRQSSNDESYYPWYFVGPGKEYGVYSENSGTPSISLSNLKPYLRTGDNTFELHLLSGGKGGEMNITFNFTGQCPSTCPFEYTKNGEQCTKYFPATATTVTASPGCLGAPIPADAADGGTQLVATNLPAVGAGMTCQTTFYSCPSNMNMNGMLCEDPTKPTYQNPNCTNLGYDPNQRAEQYLCINQKLDECSALDLTKCSEKSSSCIHIDEVVGSPDHGKCLATEYTYSCPIAAQTMKSTSCSYDPMCFNGNCFTPPGQNCTGTTVEQERTEASSCSNHRPHEYRQCSLVEKKNAQGNVTGYDKGSDCASINTKGTTMSCTMIPPVFNTESGHYPSQLNYSCVGTLVSGCSDIASKTNCKLSSKQCIEHQCLDPMPLVGSEEQAGNMMQPSGFTSVASGLNTCTNKGACLLEEVVYGCTIKTSMPGDECTQDLSKVLVSMETARQAGTYMNPDDLRVFKGEFSRCDRRAFSVMGAGLGSKSCCNISAPDAKSNSDVLSPGAQLGYSLVGGVVGEASKYVYDYMMSSEAFQNAGQMAWGAGILSDSAQAGIAASAPNFNPANMLSYSPIAGLSFGYSATAGAAGTVTASTNAVGLAQSTTSLGGGFQMTFTPVMFYVAVAMKIWEMYNAALACDEHDYNTATKTGGKLCYSTGTWCESKDCGLSGCTCTKYRTGKCCFNSKLSRIINQQGRAQLGLDMRDCGGFTVDQIQKLDWSKIDLSEFTADMLAQAQASTSAIMSDTSEKLKGNVESKAKTNATSGSQPLPHVLKATPQ